MDESLSDFQEKKQFYDSKKSLKSVKTQTKSKNSKPVKRIKGQKDIRSALKTKNDLICYTKNFNNVCKQSEIDIDGEQLQLAIALSKSLLPSEPSAYDSHSSNSLSTQEHIRRIRTTLQEYGFKVPKNKVTSVTHKRLKKSKINYKLISASELEKQQVVIDKYTQILFDNTDDFRTQITITDSHRFSSTTLFNTATNLRYEAMKNSNVFYVDELIEKNLDYIGCLLRDWSEIPGRPKSPKLFEVQKMNVSEIECSQDELDIVLSGSLKSTKDIFKRKNLGSQVYSKNIDDCSIALSNVSQKISEVKPAEIININENYAKVKSTEQYSYKHTELISTVSTERTNVSDKLELEILQPCRSASPDIFDEEVFHVTVTSDTICKNLHTTKTKSKLQESMDLTDCIVVPNGFKLENTLNYDKETSQLSQGSNRTSRKSNDFMEITECVITSSQPIREHLRINIDLTQSSNEGNKNLISDLKRGGMELKSMDLTQTSSSDEDTLPFVQFGDINQDSLDNTIILDDDKCPPNNHNKEKVIIVEDENDLLVNHNSNSNIFRNKSCKEPDLDTSLIISEINRKSSTDNNLQDYEYHHLNHCRLSKSNSSTSRDNINEIDLTQKSVSIDASQKNINTFESDTKTKRTKTFLHTNRKPNFDVSKIGIDLIQQLDSSNESQTSVTTSESNRQQLIKNDSSSNETPSFVNPKIGIDLSLNSDSDSELQKNYSKNQLVLDNSHSLGQDYDVSIDYDEICEVDDTAKFKNLNNEYTEEEVDPYPTKKQETDSGIDSNSNMVSEIRSYVNEIDHEDDCLLNNSHQEIPVSNFDFGGISVLDNFSKIKSFRNSAHNVNCENEQNISVLSTPYKEFIIKTDQVTPMLDYDSMSTPDRNKELEKYGLKPFKRKRAIQLLTHVYNQTHPIVEQCCKDLLSPSKKHKQEKSTISPRKLKSPKKANSPKKSAQIEETAGKENIFEVTKELPDIKSIECIPEDWVFQKREKAKIYSCRVPLHIAFHNYVSCRRGLREAILRYEPVNIDVIHKELAASGHRYDPKDLLKFLDKKCVTVKTAYSNSGKRY